jgi:hypothetical protein
MNKYAYKYKTLFTQQVDEYLKFQVIINKKVKVKQSHYRPGQAQRVPGG